MSYSLYTHGNNNNNRETHRMTDTEIIDVYPSESIDVTIIFSLEYPVATLITKFNVFRQKEK